MCETSFRWGEGEEGGEGRSGGGGHGQGEEKDEKREDEKGWVKVGGHGEGRGGVSKWVLVCIFECVILYRVSQCLLGLQGMMIQKKSLLAIDFLSFFPSFLRCCFYNLIP